MYKRQDESWLDVTASTSIKGDGMKIAKEISSRIKYELGVTVSKMCIRDSNKSIHIRNTKNRRDRYTILADRTLDLLTEY